MRRTWSAGERYRTEAAHVLIPLVWMLFPYTDFAELLDFRPVLKSENMVGFSGRIKFKS